MSETTPQAHARSARMLFGEFLGHLPARRRRQLGLLFLLMLAGALAEILTIGAVVPFLSLMARPGMVAEYPALHGILSRLGWQGTKSPVLPMTAVFLGMAVLATGIRLLLLHASNRLMSAIAHDIGVKLYRVVLHQPYAFHITRNTGDVIADVGKVQLLLSTFLRPAIDGLIAVILTIAILAALMMVDAAIALGAGLMFGAIYLIVIRLFRSRLKANSRVIADTQGRRIRAVQEGLGGIRDVLLDGNQGHYVREFAKCDGELIVGSHIDAVASVGAPTVPDSVSVADFVLHGVVTYPFTFFEGVKQTPPAQIATLQVLNGEGHRPSRETYWVPTETNPYASLPEAAEDLRAGVTGYIAAASKDAIRVAHSLSAGEDSRVVASILGESWKAANRPEAYIFLDSLNREGRIAQTVADKVGSKFNLMLRPGDHYLVSADKIAALVGSGHQVRAAHSFPWAIEAGFASYDAVFGGYSADSMLKGHYVAKHPLVRKLPFLPQVSASARCSITDVDSGNFSKDVLVEVNTRRTQHLQRIAEFRPSSALEWFTLYPSTMRATMSRLHTNRRLFRSYEPYMSLGAVKVGAAAPVAWKLNRRLFRKAFKPVLVTTRWTPHADGRFPAMP